MNEKTTMQEGQAEIVDSISRRAGNFALTRAPAPGTVPGPQQPTQPFVLQIGSWRAVNVGKKTGQQGFLITIGITRERLIELRDLCNALLATVN